MSATEGGALPDTAQGSAAGAAPATAAEALADLLAREAALLQAGALDGLEALAAEKEALAARLALDGVALDAAATRRLQAAAQRNAMLLQAARDGLAAAGRRLAELGGAPPALHTYDGSGRRARLEPAAPRNSRRS